MLVLGNVKFQVNIDFAFLVISLSSYLRGKGFLSCFVFFTRGPKVFFGLVHYVLMHFLIIVFVET